MRTMVSGMASRRVWLGWWSGAVVVVLVSLLSVDVPLAGTQIDAEAAGVSAVTAGSNHTCALTAAGQVRCWGSNGVGEVGDGTTGNDRLIPVDVCATGAVAPCTGESNNILTSVAAVSTFGSHTCVLVTVGGVKCWGYNSNGELGNGTTTSSAIPVDVLSEPGGPPLGDVAVVAAGKSHTCVLMTAGSVKCWGWNQFGQLGNGTTTDSSTPIDVLSEPGGLPLSGVVAVAAGGEHTCAVTTPGGVKCWGLNGVGQLGDGTTTQRNTPVDICATGATPPCTETKGNILADVPAIDAGRYHTCALAPGGGVKCWGWNLYGQLGDGTTTQRTTPVDVCASGEWDMVTSQCRDSGEPSPLSGVTAVTAGGDGGQTCALTTAEAIKCWGQDAYGQLGNGKTTGPGPNPNPVNVCAAGALAPCGSNLLSGVVAATTGRAHTCAMMVVDIKCWGLNAFGQLGDGQSCGTFSCSTPVAVVGPKGVGGNAELPDVQAAPLETQSSSVSPRVVAGSVAAIAVASVFALGGAAWYVRRRLLL